MESEQAGALFDSGRCNVVSMSDTTRCLIGGTRCWTAALWQLRLLAAAAIEDPANALPVLSALRV